MSTYYETKMSVSLFIGRRIAVTHLRTLLHQRIGNEVVQTLADGRWQVEISEDARQVELVVAVECLRKRDR